MKRALVRIEKTSQLLKYDFDNFVTRDEVEQMAYSKNPALRQMKEDKTIRSDDFFITWHELDVNGDIMTYEDVLDAAPEEDAVDDPTPKVAKAVK